MKKKDGKNEILVDKLEELMQRQIQFQFEIVDVDFLPQDLPKEFSYHMLAMMEEMGEVLKADKRWKTHRNKRFVFDEKLDEIADLFITLMNICIFSNISSNKLIEAVENKISENYMRIMGDKSLEEAK